MRGLDAPRCATCGPGGPILSRCAMRGPGTLFCATRGPVVACCAMRGPGASRALRLPVRVYQRRLVPPPVPAPPSPGSSVPASPPTPPPPVPLARYAQPVHVYERRPVSPLTPIPPAMPPSPAPPGRAPARSHATPPVYHPPVLHRDPSHVHLMVTRRAAGVLRPKVLSVVATEPRISPVLSSVRDALAYPHWSLALEEEYAALLANQMWDLVPRPSGCNVTHKRRADGTLERYKARWVLRGFTNAPAWTMMRPSAYLLQCEQFSRWLSPAPGLVHQLDVKNAFLHGTLTETVYCSQPAGFVDPARLEMVCRLNKLLGLDTLGLPRSWSLWGSLRPNTSLFVYHHGDETVYLLLYVDDIVLTASNQHLLQRIITSLRQEFAMKDLGVLHHFLGVTVEPRPFGLLLHQRQYTLYILERVGMADCNPCSTPVDTQAKLSEDAGTLVADPIAYRSLAGALQYLTFTRPDITYAVQQVCLHMHDPREPYLTALKRLLRYLRGTIDHGMLLHRSSSTELVVYTNADWAGPRRSTSGYAVFLGGNLVSWSSKRQPVVSRSSAEAEYRAVANGVAEASWLRQLLAELHSPLAKSTLVYCDNVSAVYLSTNPVQHQQTKHVEIDLHFVHDRVAIGDVRVLHVPTTSQFTDIFTKGLPPLRPSPSSVPVSTSAVARVVTAGGLALCVGNSNCVSSLKLRCIGSSDCGGRGEEIRNAEGSVRKLGACMLELSTACTNLPKPSVHH
ncbi:LOW QUALITY PROTEIN: hypothetical protein U9M48_029135 [Paspalum notatum var. saurae]|uniref:Reverse transcriptase Ty1/copia-type domain-containing protein n=1 Tax=Paspalum notatum var. saurae TaxID=547442 RepID=A0AAQ3TWW4_PASNO